MKPGYKQTEVGVIPEDWNIVKLGRVASFRTGPFGSALHRSDYVYGGVPIVNPMQIVDGRIVPTPSMAISADASRKLADFRLSAGDIVIGRRGEMGRCANVQPAEDGWLCGTGSMIVKPSPALDGRFAQRVLSSPSVIAAIENCSVGTTMINLNQGTLSNLVIALPPTKDEQEDIAEALSDADTLIESLAQLLAKKLDLKQGAIQELLTGKRRLPGFSAPWMQKPLTFAIEELEAGVSVNSTDEPTSPESGEACILKTSAVLGGFFFPEECKKIASQDLHRADVPLRGNTIIISRMNTPDLVGECGYVAADHPSLFLPDRLWMTKMRASSKTNARWLAYSLSSESHAQQIKAAATGTSGSMKNLSKPSLLSLHIHFPEPDEQAAIASIISGMDDEITTIESKLTKARQLKQGMMQALLTGRIRLI